MSKEEFNSTLVDAKKDQERRKRKPARQNTKRATKLRKYNTIDGSPSQSSKKQSPSKLIILIFQKIFLPNSYNIRFFMEFSRAF